MHDRFQKDKPFFIRCNTSSSYGSSLGSAFVGGGRTAPDEERLVLLKPVLQIIFLYRAHDNEQCSVSYPNIFYG